MLQDLSVLDEEHKCPHCGEKLSCCEAPQVHVGDGLGWGSEVLFICLNDYCSLFLNGWQTIEDKYGHHASYRYMELPGSTEGNLMMVGNKDAFKASLITKEMILEQNERYQKEQKALSQLETCLEEKNLEPVLTLILDEGANIKGRKHAVELLLQLNDLSCIDPIRNHTFKDKSLQQGTDVVIMTLLKKNFKKECPACGEIIKAQAKKCMHCGELFDEN